MILFHIIITCSIFCMFIIVKELVNLFSMFIVEISALDVVLSTLLRLFCSSEGGTELDVDYVLFWRRLTTQCWSEMEVMMSKTLFAFETTV